MSGFDNSNHTSGDVASRAMLADEIFGLFLSHSEIDEHIKSIFTWDDVIVQRRENPIF